MGGRQRNKSDKRTYLVEKSQSSLHMGVWTELLGRYKECCHTKEPLLRAGEC